MGALASCECCHASTYHRTIIVGLSLPIGGGLDFELHIKGFGSLYVGDWREGVYADMEDELYQKNFFFPPRASKAFRRAGCTKST